MDKEDVVYIHIHIHIHTMDYYSAIKKEQNNAICSNMDTTEIIILSEVSHIEKDQYHLISLINGI